MKLIVMLFIYKLNLNNVGINQDIENLRPHTITNVYQKLRFMELVIIKPLVCEGISINLIN